MRYVVVFVAAALFACGGTSGSSGTGSTGSGDTDAGTIPDASVPDDDGGPTGTPDAGNTPDAGATPDAGTAPDAGATPDGGGVVTPPPADECAGMLPASLPQPVVPAMPCAGHCDNGTSDDGAGNFALQFGVDPRFPNDVAYDFVQVRNGAVTFHGGTQSWDAATFVMFSQPSGFSSLIGDFEDSALRTYPPDGSDGNAPDVTFPGRMWAAPDPSGGFGIIDRVQQGNGSWNFRFQRFDKNNAPLTPHNLIFNGSADYTFVATAMTISHDTLALFQLGQTIVGSWIAADGTPTALFPVSAGGSLQFMLGGGLIQHAGNAFVVWKDLALSPSAAPAWLQARGEATWLFPVRGGTGYALGGTCSGVEVVATSGKSCGCTAVPGVSAATTVGRDGSLIVPRTDHYELYPALFH